MLNYSLRKQNRGLNELSKFSSRQCAEKEIDTKPKFNLTEWRERNRERINAIAHKSYMKHQEKRKLWQKEYRAKNKEREAKRKIKWYKEHREQVIKRVIKNYNENAERFIAYSGKHSKEHRIECNANVLARRHIPITTPCQICGGTENLLRHHTDYSKPLEVQIVCTSCHKRIHLKSVVLPGMEVT